MDLLDQDGSSGLQVLLDHLDPSGAGSPGGTGTSGSKRFCQVLMDQVDHLQLNGYMVHLDQADHLD
jgi:hypothetical protein